MSSLTAIDKLYLEKILGMESGYVLDFSNTTFGQFFDRHEVNISSNEFGIYGTSKANKLRAFWKLESDQKVAVVIEELLQIYKVKCELNNRRFDSSLFEECRAITARLSGKGVENTTEMVDDFLDKEFSIPNIHRLPIETQVATIIEARLHEARIALKAKGAFISDFLCGSILEGVLLGAATKPRKVQSIHSQPQKQRRKVRSSSIGT